MNLLLNIKNIEFKEELDDFWWSETDYLKIALECLERNGFLKYVHYFNYCDKFKKINNISDILEQISKIKKNRGFFSLHSENTKEYYIEISLRPDFFGIQIILNEDFLIKDEEIIHKLIRLLVSEYEALKQVAIFGDDISIWLLDFEYPQIKPLRDKKFIGNTTVVNFIHREYFEKNPNLKFEGFENLFTEKLPEGITREMIDDLCIIKWCDTVNEQEKLQKILMERESWIYKCFELPIDSSYNEHGDEKMFGIGELPTNSRDSFFAFYDPIGNTGFKPIVLNENNYLDPEIEATLKRYLERGSLENGDPLEKIVLILPSRKYVMEIYEKVKKIGVYKVIYTDNHGMLWNPFPVGNWRE